MENESSSEVTEWFEIAKTFFLAFRVYAALNM